MLQDVNSVFTVKRLKDFDSIPVRQYVEIIVNNTGIKNSLKVETVLKDCLDTVEQLKSQTTFEQVKKDYIMNSLSDILNCIF